MSQRPGYLASQIAQDFEFRVQLLQPSLSPERITQRLVHWTGGQPFLTYRLYELLIQGPLASWAMPEQPLPNASPVFDVEAEWVDRYIRDKLVKHCHDPELVRHLREICKCMIHDPRSVQMLKLYRQLLAGRQPKANLRNYVQLRLVQSGLAKIEGEYLVLSNRFYGEVFDRRWLVRAFRTVEARLRDEAVIAIEKVFAEQQSVPGRQPAARLLHPELQDRALLLTNTRRGSDCLLLNHPEQSISPRPNPYRHGRGTAIRMAIAVVACALGAASVLIGVNFDGETRHHLSGEHGALELPSTHQVRDFLRDLRR